MIVKERALLLVLLLLVGLGVGFVARDYRQSMVMRSERQEYFVDTLRYSEVTPVEVDDSLYRFRDTVEGRWSAEVTGSNVALRSLVLLDPREVRREYRRPEWDVALKGGVAPKSCWAGVGVSRSFGRMTLSLDGGYDAWRETPYVGLSASYSIWRE